MSQAESSTSLSDQPPAGPVLRRRGLLAALGAPAVLAGCGFHPLNGPPVEGEGSAAVGSQLAAIRIGPTYSRPGQLLHQSLERRLAARDRSGPAARYLLTTSILPSYEAQGYRRDGSPSRIRIAMSVPWTLATLAVPPQQIATGTARAFDSFNVVDNEFFSSVVSSEAAERRLVDQIAEDITIRLALAFRDIPAA